jgi:hypothetical protein
MRIGHPARHAAPHHRRGVLVAAAGAVLAAGIGGLAHAYWAAGGAGSGTSGSGTTTALTLTAATPSLALYPGGQSSVVLSAANPNVSATMHITSLSLNTAQGTNGFAVDAGHASCGVAALSFTTQTNGGSGWDVPARAGAVDGTLAITLSNALAMGASAANACQGATITVYLAANG